VVYIKITSNCYGTFWFRIPCSYSAIGIQNHGSFHNFHMCKMEFLLPFYILRIAFMSVVILKVYHPSPDVYSNLHW
jgi:hypothetical protein